MTQETKKILDEILKLKMMKPQTQEVKEKIQKLQQKLEND